MNLNQLVCIGVHQLLSVCVHGGWHRSLGMRRNYLVKYLRQPGVLHLTCGCVLILLVQFKNRNLTFILPNNDVD